MLYNEIMFLSLQTYVVAILISLIVLQYAFALFCLLKLAYFDVDRLHFVLWNLLILIVFFIGGAAFLIYYYKHPEKKIKRATDALEPQTADDKPEADGDKCIDGENENGSDECAASDVGND